MQHGDDLRWVWQTWLRRSAGFNKYNHVDMVTCSWAMQWGSWVRKLIRRLGKLQFFGLRDCLDNQIISLKNLLILRLSYLYYIISFLFMRSHYIDLLQQGLFRILALYWLYKTFWSAIMSLCSWFFFFSTGIRASSQILLSISSLISNPRCHLSLTLNPSRRLLSHLKS